MFKAINGYEGLYEVSERGEVRSLYFKEAIILKPGSNRGYKKVSLSHKGKSTGHSVHRLVAIAFIPNPENKPYVNHKNAIKSDNRVENLEWCTQKENVKHAYLMGLNRATKNNHFKAKNPSKGKFGQYSYNAKPILQLTKCGGIIRKWYSMIDIQRELGIKQSNISKCCHGQRELAGGFKWKFS